MEPKWVEEREEVKARLAQEERERKQKEELSRIQEKEESGWRLEEWLRKWIPPEIGFEIGFGVGDERGKDDPYALIHLDRGVDVVLVREDGDNFLAGLPSLKKYPSGYSGVFFGYTHKVYDNQFGRRKYGNNTRERLLMVFAELRGKALALKALSEEEARQKRQEKAQAPWLKRFWQWLGRP